MTVQSTPSPLRRRRFRRNRHLVARRGATAVLVALCALPIVAVLALAVDIGVFYRARRNQQNAADAAALAWAHERFSHPASLADEAETRLATAAAAHGYTNGQNGTLISSQILTWGSTPNAIRVTIRDTVSTFFSGVLGRSRTVVAATAVATFDLANSTSCVYALHPTATDALHLSGNSRIEMPNCGVQVNSVGTPALSGNGTYQLISASNGVAGTVRQVGNGTISPPAVTGALQAPDPLASVSVPPLPSGFACTTPVTFQGGNQNAPPVPVPSGVYCSRLVIKRPVSMSGVYYLLGGMEASANAKLTGDNVTILNLKEAGYTAGNINITAGTVMNLKSDTTVMRGILFYQDPDLTLGARIRGSPDSDFRGSLYFPAADLDMTGGGAFTMTGSIVASTVQLGGGGNFRINASSATTAGWFSIKRVTLVD